jgi:hypothetical protein
MIETETEFKEYRLLILNEIDRMNLTMGKFQEALAEIVIDINSLKITDKFRSGLWGGVGGIITTVITVGVTLIVERLLNPK